MKLTLEKAREMLEEVRKNQQMTVGLIIQFV